ncbi:MAG TPA: hypothetical protein DHE23_23690 [Agrobacterium sp.]|nr:hypothetical protein [Agrobacterium sp.]
MEALMRLYEVVHLFARRLGLKVGASGPLQANFKTKASSKRPKAAAGFHSMYQSQKWLFCF